MKLTVNLVTKRPVDVAVLRKLATALLLLLGLWLLVTVGMMIMVRHKHQNIMQLLSEMPEKVAVPAINAGSQKEVQAEISKTERILQRRGFRWSRILNHLEKTSLEGIQIRSIQPDFEKQTLAIQILARDETVFREYLENLLRYEPFSQVLLLRQENVDIKDAVGQTFAALRCEISIRGGF